MIGHLRRGCTPLIAVGVLFACHTDCRIAKGEYALLFARQATNDLNTELSSSVPRRDSWHTYLDWEALLTQLNSGDQADLEVLSQLRTRLALTERPIDRARLETVERPLRNWSDLLQGSPGDSARVRTTLRDLETWLATNKEQGPRWREYLLLDQLNATFAAGSHPDVAIVRDALLRLERPVPGITASRFARLRRSLESWTAHQAEGPPTEPERDAARPADLAQAVTDPLTELDEWLGRVRGRQQAWRKILQMDNLEALLQSDEPDPDAVREIHEIFQEELTHQDRKRFIGLRQALSNWQAKLENPVEEALSQAARAAKTRFVDVDTNRVLEARRKLVRNVRRLDQFLNSGTKKRNKSWREFLKWDDLRMELSDAGQPSLVRLAGVYNQFRSGEAGLEMKPFANVRQSLRNYLELLQLTEGEPRRRAEEKRRLRDALQDFDRFLARGTPPNETGWKSFLKMADLEAALQEETPDIRELRRIHARFKSNVDGLENRNFRRLAQRLYKYTEVVQLNLGTRAADRYAGQLEKLAQLLQQHATAPTGDTSAQVMKSLRWLQTTGYLSDLVARVKGTYASPNLHLAISGNLLTQEINDVRTESEPINRCFEGAHVRGIATTTAFFSGQLVPSQFGAIIDIVVNGTTSTRATGTQRRVNVYTNGQTRLTARKRLFLTPDGISSSPARTQATTSQNISGVNVNRRCGRRLIGRLARRKATRTTPKAEHMATSEARQRLAERMDREVGELLAKANEQIRDGIQKLREAELYPEQLTMRSTATQLVLAALSTSNRVLGATTQPPPAPASSDVAVRVHESALNGLIGERLAGVKIDNDRLVKMLEERNLEVPDELKPNGEEDDVEYWSLTFDELQPVTVNFSEGKLRIGLRGQKFVRDDQEISELIELSGTYTVMRTSDGHVEAIREGDTEIVFINSPDRLTPRQITYKTFLKRKVGSLFADRFSTAELPESEWTEQLDNVRVDQLRLIEGWMAVGLNVNEAALEELNLLSAGS